MLAGAAPLPKGAVVGVSFLGLTGEGRIVRIEQNSFAISFDSDTDLKMALLNWLTRDGVTSLAHRTNLGSLLRGLAVRLAR